MKLIAISAFGVLGVLSRYFVDSYFAKKTTTAFPIGIFTVNLVGCFLIGILFSLTKKQILTSEQAQVFSIGFLGALTTFSTFSMDVFKLIFVNGQYALGSAYLIISPLAGLLMTWGGFAISQFFTVPK